MFKLFTSWKLFCIRLSCDYKYSLAKAPEWYLQSLKDHLTNDVGLSEHLIYFWAIPSVFKVKLVIGLSSKCLIHKAHLRKCLSFLKFFLPKNRFRLDKTRQVWNLFQNCCKKMVSRRNKTGLIPVLRLRSGIGSPFSGIYHKYQH